MATFLFASEKCIALVSFGGEKIYKSNPLKLGITKIV